MKNTRKKLSSFPSLLEKRQSTPKDLEVRICLAKVSSTTARVQDDSHSCTEEKWSIYWKKEQCVCAYVFET